MQESLLSQVHLAKNTIDFNNIGNTWRNILQKLAEHIYKPERHSNGRDYIGENHYKNRFNAYINFELSGGENSKLKAYALSVVDTSEKAINLANSLTHDKNADKMQAELCALATITVVRVISIIINGIRSLDK